MSYSIGARARNFTIALAGLTARFDNEVLAQQPAHAADREAALEAVRRQGALVREAKEGEVVVINLSGSLGHDAGAITAATTNASVFVGGTAPGWVYDDNHTPYIEG